MGPGRKAKGSSSACQPVTVGFRVAAKSGCTQRKPAPGPPQSHLTEPPMAACTPQASSSSGTAPVDW